MAPGWRSTTPWAKCGKHNIVWLGIKDNIISCTQSNRALHCFILNYSVQWCCISFYLCVKLSGNNPCEQRCTPVGGWPQCSCFPGFALSTNGHSCEGIFAYTTQQLHAFSLCKSLQYVQWSWVSVSWHKDQPMSCLFLSSVLLESQRSPNPLHSP